MYLKNENGFKLGEQSTCYSYEMVLNQANGYNDDDRASILGHWLKCYLLLTHE